MNRSGDLTLLYIDTIPNRIRLNLVLVKGTEHFLNINEQMSLTDGCVPGTSCWKI